MTPIPLLALVFLALCSGAVRPVDDLRYLDPDHRSLAQPIASFELADPSKVKFVEVEIAEVTNPRRTTLVFEVYYDRGAEGRVHLGDFALYPPDHPGRFLVASQGRVKRDGSIVLMMTSPKKMESGDSIRVGVKRIRFRER